jgi:hypothetical protein
MHFGIEAHACMDDLGFQYIQYGKTQCKWEAWTMGFVLAPL